MRRKEPRSKPFRRCKDDRPQAIDAFEQLQEQSRSPETANVEEWMNDIPSPPLLHSHLRFPLLQIPNNVHKVKRKYSETQPQKAKSQCTRMDDQAANPKWTGAQRVTRSQGNSHPLRSATSPKQKSRPSSDTRDIETLINSSSKGSSAMGDETPRLAMPLPQTPIRLEPPSTPARRKKKESTSSSRPPSPSKATLTEQLGQLRPQIICRNWDTVKDVLRGQVEDLWLNHLRPSLIDKHIIPQALQARLGPFFDTPLKSKIPPDDDRYGSPFTLSRDDENLMFYTALDVYNTASKYRDMVHEPQWADVTVHPLLHLTRRLRHFQGGDEAGCAGIEVLNVTTVEISPPDLIPRFDSARFQNLNKKVDYCVALDLKDSESDSLAAGIYADDIIYADGNNVAPKSINQTSNYINFKPIFLNLEVKGRSHGGTNPMVQLGGWILAEFNKREKEGYPCDVPVLAITVTEHEWAIWVIYQRDPDNPEDSTLVFVGPRSMGTTTDFEGIFRILRVLFAIANWGGTVYNEWFRKEILGRYLPKKSKTGTKAG